MVIGIVPLKDIEVTKDLPTLQAETAEVLSRLEVLNPYETIAVLLSIQTAMREMPTDEDRALFLSRWLNPFQVVQQ